MNLNTKIELTAGGPGSGRHPGGGLGERLKKLGNTDFLKKYDEWVSKPGNNPDVLEWYRKLDDKSTEMLHKFVDYVVKDYDTQGNQLPKQHVDPWDK